MDIKAQYLEAMRSQAPALYRRTPESALMAMAADVSIEAERMFRQLTRDKPKPLSMQDRREAEEQVRATLIQFPPSDETTMEQDEQNALGSQPIVSPERTTA